MHGRKIIGRAKRRINRIPREEVINILMDVAVIRDANPGFQVRKIVCRLLTDGYWSQSIDAAVFRQLGVRAGWIKPG